MKIRNIGSNQTEMVTEEATVLISYSTPVAAFVHGEFVVTDLKYSQTTSRHINKWLAENGVNNPKSMPQSFLDSLTKETIRHGNF